MRRKHEGSLAGDRPMTQMRLDTDLANRLLTCGQPLELCDPTGQVLGTFFPRTGSADDDEPDPFTDEELDQAEEQPGGRSLAEILADLGKS
jgi:hypothetical protein